MVKVVAPLFSIAASGTIGDVLTYVCGLYARKAEGAKPLEFSEEQAKNRTKWSTGCEVWGSEENDQRKWREFVKLISQSEECPTRFKYYMTGFQTFMSFYMDLGPDGWPNYPQPPI